MPVRIGRVSSRDAERATRLIVSTNAAAGTLTTVSPPGSGSGGKSSARSVRMWNVAEPERISTSCSAGRSSSVASLPGSERATSSSRRAGRTTVPSRSTVGGERNAQADVHVRRAQLGTVGEGVELDAGERLNGAARRSDAGDHAELREQIRRGRRELHDEHLGYRLEVIGHVQLCRRTESRGGCGRACAAGRANAWAECVKSVGVREG